MGKNFKSIKAWELSDRLVYEIYRITGKPPREEIFGVISQIRRAAVSIPGNIAGGMDREHKKDRLNFLFIARGSMAEVEYLLYLCNKLHFGRTKGF